MVISFGRLTEYTVFINFDIQGIKFYIDFTRFGLRTNLSKRRNLKWTVSQSPKD